MTTKRNLVSKMFMSIITTGLFATALTACKDELKDEAFNADNTETFVFTNLEQYGYAVPVKVNVEGDWKVDLKFADEDHMFCYAYPDHGHGPATIKLCMLDNWTNERNAGEMTIVDLGNPNNNKVYPLNQKCNLDYGCFTRAANDSTETKPKANAGDRNFGVGYGYNVTAQPGNGAVSLNPIIKLEALKATEGCGAGISSNSKINVDQFSARSIVELANKLTFSSNIKGS